MHRYFSVAVVLFSMLLLTSCGKKDYEYGTLNDSRDNKSYKTIDVNGKLWMAENISYEGGSELATKIDSSAACRYNPAGDASNVNTYGYLYNYKAAKTACPDGWHIPSVSEFEKLADAFAADENDNLIGDFQCLSAGGFNGSYVSFGKRNYFWTSTELDADSAYMAKMAFYELLDCSDKANKLVAMSVRCVKD